MGISLKDIHEQLTEIANTPSTNDKVVLLKRYLQNKRFRNICWMTYTSTITFNVKSFPDFKKIGFCDRGWEYVKPILKVLAQKRGADLALKNKLFQSAAIDKETYDIVERICNGDLKIGAGARLINKAYPGIIKLWSYMRCATSKHMHNIDFSEYAIAQCKADGAFANMFISQDGDISFNSRDGKEIKCLSHLKSQIKHQEPKIKHGSRKGIDNDTLGQFLNRVYFGELRVFDENGNIMPRKAGNGIINQCIDGTVDPKVAKRIFYTVWDTVTIPEFWNGESEIVLRSRFFNAISLVKCVDNDKYLRLIDYEEVRSLEEAYSFFRRMRKRGDEGAIIKNIAAGWEDNESGSKDQIKIKHSFECELRVIGWKHGKKGSKYEKIVGAIICESECGGLRVSVSGLTDDERKLDWTKFSKSRAIVTVEAESVITSKIKELASLYTPSFIEIRKDKKKADDLKRILEISKESAKTRRRKA